MIKKGFTLLEMLVVIGIIAVLIGMVVSSYSTAQKKARDSRRQSDLKAAQQILEQCYSVNDFEYPDITGDGTAVIAATCPLPNNNLTFSITDPLGTFYTVSSTTTDYSIDIALETGTSFSISSQQ